MSVHHHTVVHQHPMAREDRGVRGWERSLGLDRPGRSRLVLLGPLVTAVGAFLMLSLFLIQGGLGIDAWLPVGLLGAVLLGGMSLSYLYAFAADARDAEANPPDGDR